MTQRKPSAPALIVPTASNFQDFKEGERSSVVRAENGRLRTRVRALEENVDRLERLTSFFEQMDELDPEPPHWLAPPTTSGNHATAVAFLSDTHFDEVVHAAEIGGYNEYNRTIATIRLERWAKGIIKLCRDYLSGVKWDGLVLMMGGDIFSGNIHDELKETNVQPLPASMVYWIEQLDAAVEMLRVEFKKIHIVAVSGNHGRQTKRPRYKQRAFDNVDWMIARFMARDFRRDKNVTWDIPDSLDAYFKIYDRGQYLAHGDEAKGGNGIAGIWSPIMRYKVKVRDAFMKLDKPFDTMWLGHFHQYIAGNGIVMNGALKGYDDYAYGLKFLPELPVQALAVITPQHGVSWQTPVFCSKREEEGW